MNKLITISRSGTLEMRDFKNSPIPIAIYPDLEKKKGTIFLVNKHPDLELLFIKRGSLKIHLDNDTFCAKENDIVVVNPNVLHNIIPQTESVLYDCIIIDRYFLNKNHLFLDNIHITETICDNSIFQFAQRIKASLIPEKSQYYIAKINSLILDMTVFIIENHSQKTSSPREINNSLVAVERGIEFINNHLDEDISLEDIAQDVGYSKFYFCRMFRLTTGYTLATYINMQRIKYAHSLLCENKLNIGEISLRCGFKSISYFSTTFKKYMGCNPSDIQQKTV